MKIKEIISEVFEPGKANWKWTFRGSEEARAQFTVGGRKYIWDAFSHFRINRPTKWEIQFRLVRGANDSDDLDLFGTTGTGNSAEVMSTAVDITRAFLQEYGLDKVEEITFNAKENSRIALYTKMIKRLLPGWDLYQKYTVDNGMEYTLTDRRAYDKPENQINEYREDDVQGLTMDMQQRGHVLTVTALDDWGNKELGRVVFNIGDTVGDVTELDPQDLEVDERYRGQGIAKVMYDWVTAQGYQINQSSDLTAAGLRFWEKHRGDKTVWESLDTPYGFDSSENEYGEPLKTTTLDDGSELQMKFYKEKIQGVDGYGFEFARNNKHNITGQGDEQRVFATALAMTQEFVNQNKPNALEFFASKNVASGQDSHSRAKLYDRMVQRYADKLGYVVDRVDKSDEIAYRVFRKT